VLADDLPRECRDEIEPLLVDVHEADRRVPELWIGEEVGDEVAGEDMAPGTDDRDLGHFTILRAGYSHLIDQRVI